ncbi:MAG: T9SS type A sorting domain-containing protein [Bacteroidales bacterium]|nr:T9SS type A sorting domain-containing protein [Bacteroidales bacterium]
MKLKLLLFSLLFFCGVLTAQDTIKTLVISECRIDDQREAYAEFTNMGTENINLSDFEFGRVDAWTVAKPDSIPNANWIMLPDRELAPGESFVVAGVHEWQAEQYLRAPQDYDPFWTPKEYWWLGDLLLHFLESPVKDDPTDSITPGNEVLQTWNGRDCLYLRHHLSNGDSALIDQVNGLFDQGNGTNKDGGHTDVAGTPEATWTCRLVRKFSVKEGNLDFENARGQDLAESEWIPIPHQLGQWEVAWDYRRVFWTVGNHGNYVLDANTLESSTVDVNFAEGILTVPWGIRNDDSIMSEFVRKPGIAWHYDYAPSHEDSAFNTCRTGDTLTIYLCGDELTTKKFRIEVAPPTTDANIVIPKYVPDEDGFYDGSGKFCWVTDGIPGMDTIYMIPYALRVDTLFKYLEKAPNADWEIVWENDTVRTDLRTGDILKVTAEDGTSVKEYYIKLYPFFPSHNANFSMITWPDVPEYLKGILGWNGDTIPAFNRNNFEYTLQVPFDTEGVPAVVAKNEDLNARHEVDRALNLTGSAADRTITFTSTAEDDTSVLVYKIELEKEKNPADIQPWPQAEPFISQVVFRDQWNNTFLEICNPGTEILDLSNYMLYFGPIDNQADAIRAFDQPEDSLSKYKKYIPGYRWLRNDEWAINPGIVFQDAAVNPIVFPHDVFVLTQIRGTGQSGYPWYASEEADIDFAHPPWDEIPPYQADNTSFDCWWDQLHYFLWKITNDSIKNGLKAATDPNDFELIEAFGNPGNSRMVINGRELDQINSFVRKPQYYEGDTVLSGSFGTDDATSEWEFRNRDYYTNAGLGWPQDILAICTGIGSHYMYEVTVYQSKVLSNTYKVSTGYSMNEELRGIVAGTTVAQFKGNITKKHDGQTLTLLSSTDGSVLADDAVLADGDTLSVLSAQYGNVTKYVLDVTAEGLSSDAVLTSDTYTITVDGGTGTIAGFDYGTALKTVVENVTVPLGAAMNIVDANDAYKPLTMLNFDTLYVDVQVDDQTYFEVIAENGVTKILYQLLPTATASDAFVTSVVFDVDQDASFINLVPDGIAVFGFLKNLIPAPGATLQVIDKYGFDRNIGTVVKDDKLVVTAQDGVTTKEYTLTMLAESDDLAYVTSDVYTVDQLLFSISGEITEETLLADFEGNLKPYKKATLRIVDSEGNAKTGDDLDNGDKVVVTSFSGENVVEYTIDVAYLAYVTSTVYTVDQTGLSISGALSPETTVADFLANLVPCEGAAIKVVDAQGADKAAGNLADGDVLRVTAGDGVTTKDYSISISFPCFVTSTVYTVTESPRNISGTTVKITTAVADFISNLVPASGATIKVVDSQGADKAAGNLAEGDVLRVTAGDGVTTADYSITLAPVSVNDLSASAIDIYPNPSSGKVHISGLEPGSRIQIFNIIGDCLIDMTAIQSAELISLEDQPDGVYIIRLSIDDEVVSHYRLILE